MSTPTRPTREQLKPAEPAAIDPGYLQKGTLVGYYEIVDRVGSGGFGALYKAVRDGKTYALKIANQNVLELPEDDRRRFEERVEREVVSLMSLRHPNIVKVHAYDRWPDSEGFQYIVMEFIAGYRIGDWCAKQTPSLRSILNAFRKLALALAEMHRLEIYHRDLKQENVMVRAADEEPFLVDFGISRPRSAVTVTREMSIFGTYTHFSPEYCKFFGSPEYFRGELFADFSPATEFWSFGVVLYQVLAGQLPFADARRTENDYLEAVQHGTPKHPGLVNPKLPDEVDALIMKLLEKRPQDRYQSGHEVAEAIEKLLASADPSWDSPFDVPNRKAPSPGSGPRGAAYGSTQTRPARPNVVAAEPAAVSADLDADVPPMPPPPPLPSDVGGDAILSADGAAPQPASANGAGPVPVSAAGRARGAAAAAHAQLMAGQPAQPSGAAARKVPLPAATFSPPTAERAVFSVPEGADAVAAPAAPQAPAAQGADLEALRAKLGSSSKPSGVKGVYLAVGGVAALGLGILFLASLDGEKKPEPQSLLQQAQVEQPMDTAPTKAKESTLPPPEEVAKVDGQGGATETAELAPLVDSKKSDKARSSKQTGKGDDATQIDAMLKEQYGRPVIEGPDSKKVAATGKSGPSWLLQAEAVEETKAESAGDKRYGVPMGEHIKVKLKTNLDSRTVADGPVEAMLMKPHVVRGNAVLPSRTMVYGTGSTSGGRFVIRFSKLRLPDHTEVDIKGLAFDIAQKKPGLSPSRRITAAGEERPGVMAEVAKGAANTLLGKTGEGTPSELAQGAGQTVLRGEGQGSSSSGEALLLDANAEFAVFVEEAF